MAKRKRLEPARLTEPKAGGDAPALRTPLAGRPPIADVAQDAATSAALEEVAGELSAARSEGRLIQRLPLDAIVDDHLVRDRTMLDPAEMDGLIASLRARGQQTPIEVADLGGGRYGLISGWRRVTALRKIARLSPELDTVLALVRQPEDAAEAYLAMVEENEIRAGLSFYERARIVTRAVEAGVFRNIKSALSTLFSNVPRSRKSKIGSFVEIVTALDGHLRFPEAISEKQGLALAKDLKEREGFADELREALAYQKPESAAEESHIIATPFAYGPQTEHLSEAERKPKPPVERPEFLITEGRGKITVTGTRLSDPAFLARVRAALEGLN